LTVAADRSFPVIWVYIKELRKVFSSICNKYILLDHFKQKI